MLTTVSLCPLFAGHKTSGWKTQGLVLWPGYFCLPAEIQVALSGVGKELSLQCMLISLWSVMYGYQLSSPRVWLCILPSKAVLHWWSAISPPPTWLFLLNCSVCPGWLLWFSSTYFGQTLLLLGPLPRQMWKPQGAGELPGRRIAQQKFN